jgi:hypothetical protein
MGLDQYAEFRKEPTKTFYWRKHAALQEYMERLWVDRTGQSSDSLNCQDMHLDEEDIEELQGHPVRLQGLSIRWQPVLRPRVSG